LYGEATPAESARVKAHLDECMACRDELAGFHRVREMLQSWELEGVPALRISTNPAPNSSTLRLLKELFLALPVWTRSLGAVAAAMLILAVLGTEIKVGKDGFTFRMSLLVAREQPREPQIAKEQIESLVKQLIAEKQEQQKADLLLKIAEIEASQGSNSSDLAKLAARIKEQHIKIEGLERDIDRREALSLTDLLLSGDSERSGSTSGAGQ
jgi:hypothetical protein